MPKYLLLQMMNANKSVGTGFPLTPSNRATIICWNFTKGRFFFRGSFPCPSNGVSLDFISALAFPVSRSQFSPLGLLSDGYFLCPSNGLSWCVFHMLTEGILCLVLLILDIWAPVSNFRKQIKASYIQVSSL